MTNSVTHFEIYGNEPGKLADFYSAAFGWRIEKAPGVEYWRIQAGSAGPQGGLMYRSVPALRGWLNYITVESIDTIVAEALRLGGELLRPKTAVPKAGWIAILADPDGNAFAVWQTDAQAFPTPSPD